MLSPIFLSKCQIPIYHVHVHVRVYMYMCLSQFVYVYTMYMLSLLIIYVGVIWEVLCPEPCSQPYVNPLSSHVPLFLWPLLLHCRYGVLVDPSQWAAHTIFNKDTMPAWTLLLCKYFLVTSLINCMHVRWPLCSELWVCCSHDDGRKDGFQG